MNGMKMIEEKTMLNDKKCIEFKERKNEADYIIIQDGTYGASCVCFHII